MDDVGSPPSALDAAWAKIVNATVLDGYGLLKSRKRAAHANGSTPPPSDLIGTVDQVRECLAWLPNRPGNHRDREDWVAIGHAIVAATAKSGEGKLAWLDWSAEHEGSAKAAHDADLLWEGIDPARCHVGIRWLAQRAHKDSDGRCTVIYDLDFDDPAAPVDLKVNVPPDVTLTAPPPPSLQQIEYMIDLLPATCTGSECDAVLNAMIDARLMPVETELLIKRIKAITGLTVETLRKQIAAAYLKRDQARTYDVPRRLADAALGYFGAKHLAFPWHHYDGKSWQRIEELAISKVMQEIALAQPTLMMSIGDSRPQNVSTAVGHGLNLLRAQVHDRLAALSKPESALRPVINANNGTLHVATSDGALIFKPHDPDDLLTYVCDVDYEPGARCPRFDAALTDLVSQNCYTVRPGEPEYAELRPYVSPIERVILPDGRGVENGPARTVKVFDRADNERLMLEVMGYTLTPWRGARAFVVCKGSGRNGKTKFWETVQKFLSVDAVQNARINELETDRYALSELFGKLLYIDDDVSRRVELPDGPLKMLSENKPISAAVKFQAHRKFVSTVLPVILCNSWPLMVDLSAGTRDRAVVLPFGREYKVEEQHKSPWPLIWSDRREMSGIFNRLLAALAQVLQRGYILPTRASAETFHTWVAASAPELEFIEACCQRTPPAETHGDGEAVNVLYSVFNSWYAINFGTPRGVHGGKRFRDVMEQLGYEVYRTGKHGWRVRSLWLQPDKVERGIGVSYLVPDESDED